MVQWNPWISFQVGPDIKKGSFKARRIFESLSQPVVRLWSLRRQSKRWALVFCTRWQKRQWQILWTSLPRSKTSKPSLRSAVFKPFLVVGCPNGILRQWCNVSDDISCKQSCYCLECWLTLQCSELVDLRQVVVHKPKTWSSEEDSTAVGRLPLHLWQWMWSCPPRINIGLQGKTNP